MLYSTKCWPGNPRCNRVAVAIATLPIEEHKENYMESRVDSAHESDRVLKKE